MLGWERAWLLLRLLLVMAQSGMAGCGELSLRVYGKYVNLCT